MNKLTALVCKSIFAIALIFGTSQYAFSSPTATITLTSAVGTNAQTKCIGTAITNITYSTGGGATGASITGLPTGINGVWAANVFTISGTPSVSGSFSYTVSTIGGGAVVTATGTITVNAFPTVSITGTNAVCIGSTTTLSPTTGGTWLSNNTAVATVTNAGVVTGVSNINPANATFRFTNTATGCTSQPTSLVTVNPLPPAFIVGSNSICVNGITQLLPSPPGPSVLYTWASNNPAIATVSNIPGITSGVVTGVNPGIVTFTSTFTSSGCSATTLPISVNPIPQILFINSYSLCVGSTTTLTASTGGAPGGNWVSSNTAVATITNAGLVTGVSAGTVSFKFTSTAGCEAPFAPFFSINALPAAPIAAAQTACNGATLANLLPAPSANIKWYSTATGGSVLTNTTILATGTYYVAALSTAGCEGLRTSVTVTINPLPLGPTAVAQTLCNPATVANLLPAPSTSIKWYNAATGGMALTNTTTLATGNYYVAAVSLAGCESPRTAVAVTVTTAPNLSYTAVPTTFCVNTAISTLTPTNNGSIANAINYAAIPTITTLGSGFSSPPGIAVDAVGNIFVPDFGNNAIKKISTNGTITVLGSGFSSPTSVAVDAAGNIFVADYGNSAIKKIATDGTITVLGSGFGSPTGVAVDIAGNIFVSDFGNNDIKKIATNGTITVLGSGFISPIGIAVDAVGNVFVADSYNDDIKKIATNGTITVLGSGFSNPHGVAVDAAGNIFVADFLNDAIKKIATNGTVTVLGSGFSSPAGVAVDATGNVYVADTYNNAVKKMSFPPFSISPDLPAGLSINGTTGAITGTPTGAAASTTYTIIAGNACGNSSTTITFAVDAGASIATVNTTQTLTIAGTTVFSYSCNSLLATVLPNGAAAISGSTTSKVWFETTQPTNFVKRHYEITPATNSTTATGNVTLYFTQAEFDDFNAVNTIKLPTGISDATGIANLRIEKRPGTSSDGTGLPSTYSGTAITIDPGDADIVWNATASRWEVSFDVTGFSGFFVKTQTGILPVQWLSVTGNINTQKQAAITWYVQENNVASYMVEKSTDARSFNAIATVNSQGDGNNIYNYIDASPITGTVYYRIQQIDRNGRSSYSSIIKLSNQQASLLTIYPNPTKNIVTISGAKVGSMASLTDINGKLLWHTLIKQNTFTIDMSKYSSAVYIFKTDTGETQKIIKE